LHGMQTAGLCTAVDLCRNAPDSQFRKCNPLPPSHHYEGFFGQGSAKRYHVCGSLRSFDHDSYELNIQVFPEKDSISEITELIFAPSVAKIIVRAESHEAPIDESWGSPARSTMTS
jgi:hypothetical protein